MSENPAGVLVLRDELTGWLAQLDKLGRESERAFCLEAWNGTNGFTMDRVGRGRVHCEYVCMSLLGGIQPGRLRSYLGDALAGGPGDDGLIQRFQVLVWPDLPADWQLVDRAPDAPAEETAATVLQRLVDLPAEDPPALFRFAQDAQELFFEWYADLQGKLRAGNLHEAMAAHLSKYGSLMSSLALLFELADQAAAGVFSSQTVSLEHARQAAAWCDYLESHARRVYSSVVSPQMRAAADLAERIKRGEVGRDGGFALRDIYRACWRDLDTPESARAAVAVLEDLEWVREVPGERTSERTGGRPRAARFIVNPKARGTA
jgi:putative DNA primase/helicase